MPVAPPAVLEYINPVEYHSHPSTIVARVGRQNEEDRLAASRTPGAGAGRQLRAVGSALIPGHPSSASGRFPFPSSKLDPASSPASRTPSPPSLSFSKPRQIYCLHRIRRSEAEDPTRIASMACTTRRGRRRIWIFENGRSVSRFSDTHVI